MLLPIRRNHIGIICTLSSSSIVAKFAIRVFESSSSISIEVRECGLSATTSGTPLVKYFPPVTLDNKRESHDDIMYSNFIKSIIHALSSQQANLIF